jgi:hypothetical protein
MNLICTGLLPRADCGVPGRRGTPLQCDEIQDSNTDRHYVSYATGFRLSLSSDKRARIMSVIYTLLPEPTEAIWQKSRQIRRI